MVQYFQASMVNTVWSKAPSAFNESPQRNNREPLARPPKARHQLSPGASIAKDLFVGFIE